MLLRLIFLYIYVTYLFIPIHCISQNFSRLSLYSVMYSHLPRVHHSYRQIKLRITGVQFTTPNPSSDIYICLILLH